MANPWEASPSEYNSLVDNEMPKEAPKKASKRLKPWEQGVDAFKADKPTRKNSVASQDSFLNEKSLPKHIQALDQREIDAREERFKESNIESLKKEIAIAKKKGNQEVITILQEELSKVEGNAKKR